MGDALERRAGGSLKKLLERLTKNKLAGFLTWLGVTAVIQSSSATTVMVVNSGIISLKQSIGVIMGDNIGITVKINVNIPRLYILTAISEIKQTKIQIQSLFYFDCDIPIYRKILYIQKSTKKQLQSIFYKKSHFFSIQFYFNIIIKIFHHLHIITVFFALVGKFFRGIKWFEHFSSQL